MQPYRFSPIQNEQQLKTAVSYVATKTSDLAEKIIGKKLSISSLTIFSHSAIEFENLQKILLTLGAFYNENNGPRVSLYNPIEINTNTIKYLRIRKPDPDRPQVGCNDFDIDDYSAFENQYLSNHPQNLLMTERPTYKMIEFFDSDFDVLAYIVSANQQ